MKRLAVYASVLMLRRPFSCHSFSAVSVALRQGLRVLPSSFQRFQKISLTMASSSNAEALRTIRVLALHGSGGTTESILEALSEWNNHMVSSTLDGNCELSIAAVAAHVEKDDGFAWWSLPPGERSSTADVYDGFDVSSDMVLKALSSQQHPQYDIVMGHSQGAILVTALLALDAIPQHPRLGYVLNGVAWPNPYTAELEGLHPKEGSGSPRVLVIVGEHDTINTPDQAARVAEALSKAGCVVTTISHPNGHAVPIERNETWEAIQRWLLQL